MWYFTTSSYSEQNPDGLADEGAQSHDSWNLHAIQVTFDFWNTWSSSHRLKGHNDGINSTHITSVSFLRQVQGRKNKILLEHKHYGSVCRAKAVRNEKSDTDLWALHIIRFRYSTPDLTLMWWCHLFPNLRMMRWVMCSKSNMIRSDYYRGVMTLLPRSEPGRWQ